MPHFISDVRASVIFVEGLAGGGDDFFQTSGKKLFARLGKVGFPSELHPKLDGGEAVGGMHELDVLHVFLGGAIDHGGDGLRRVVVGGEFEFVECREEMIVTGFIAGPPIAHGPGVDDLVVKDLVVIRASDRRLGSVSIAGVAGRSQQARGRAVNAEIVGGREVDEIFGVDSAAEMVVQVSALRHVVQKRQQHRRLLADGIEIAGSFLFGGLRLRRASRWRE